MLGAAQGAGGRREPEDLRYRRHHAQSQRGTLPGVTTLFRRLY